MLFIFRKIRRSFFLPGKVRTYLAYAAGEIILIMAGILLALQVSEWYQERRDRAEERVILERLKSDFETNRERLEINENLWRGIAERLRDFQLLMGPDPEEHPDELINHYVTAFLHIPAFSPNQGVLNSLIASGKIALVRNEDLNYKLNSWPTMIEGYRYTLNFMLEHSSKNLPEFRSLFPLRNLQIDPAKADPRYQKVSERIGHFTASGSIGPSRFSSDQKTLLSSMELESAVESKRLNSGTLVYKIADLQQLQDEILELIDEELANR